MADGANIEIRPARAEEMKALRQLAGYAFADTEMQKDNDQPDPLQPAQSYCAFDGEQMVASSGAYEFKMRLNGLSVAADGVTMVSCDPGYRRKGVVRQLIDGLLQRSKAREVPVSILWASMGAIYQRFGYGLGGTTANYEIAPRFIQFQFGERAPGYVRLMSKEDALQHLQAAYDEYSAAGNGMLKRGGVFWELMLRPVGDQRVWIAVYFDKDDVARGYCLYRTSFDASLLPAASQTIDVFDFIWLDMDAYRGLWGYLGSHDLADRVRMEFVAEDDPAPSLFLEPRMLHRKTLDGVWMRVVDVQQALEARGYDVSGEAVIEIVGDDLCAWNNGCYRLSADTEQSSVERLKGANPDVVTRPEAFAALLSGQARPSDLARMGRLSIPDPDRAVALDGLFSTRRRPHCPNMF